MSRDVWTIVWKEWKELLARQGRFRGGAVNFVLVLATFGIFVPLQFGRAWVESPMMLIYWGWVPLMLLANMVVDAIAGERERHTLETLLASRLPDAAILLGKMLAAVLYGLSVTAGSLVIGLVTVNVLVTDGPLVLYPLAVLAGALVTSVLGATLVAGLGVLVSLRAASVRQAAQLMGMATLLVTFIPIVALRSFAKYLAAAGHPPGSMDTALVGAVALCLFVALDAGVIGVTLLRFRRSRLVAA